ncbi:hypothetical protein B0T26DRAFT_716713 [Lasiosphaeria miniovina]|uniref:Uncharacterized protein n=1 Tax=Lasiosphaeria miniovina TaxID=1954250 RepID=A0AA40AC85_9PEZI|nr:uncharacterized protein B0T26DRAFT_716713 [Lasiosphaeria miniovina]KAK0713183.1 hypothetical protein B0T26DRAFT_716713 [Lasiosphaeria miniovina]
MAANPCYVAYHNFWTIEQARAEAIAKFDLHEIKRVTEHNRNLVIYWARKRLARGISESPNLYIAAGAEPYTVPAAPVQDDGIEENRNELVPLRTCRDILFMHRMTVECMMKIKNEYPMPASPF